MMHHYIPYGAKVINKYIGRRRNITATRVGTKKLALRNAQKIKRIQRGSLHELKTHDLINSTAIGSTGAIFGISLITQGDSSLTREGLQIQPTSLEYKLRLVINTSAVASVVRILIFRDTQQQGTIPTIAELLEADSTVSFKQHDTRPRFKILRDMIIPMSITGSSRVQFIKGYTKMSSNSVLPTLCKT